MGARRNASAGASHRSPCCAVGQWKSLERLLIGRNARLIGAYNRNELARRLLGKVYSIVPAMAGRSPDRGPQPSAAHRRLGHDAAPRGAGLPASADLLEEVGGDATLLVRSGKTDGEIVWVGPEGLSRRVRWRADGCPRRHPRPLPSSASSSRRGRQGPHRIQRRFSGRRGSRARTWPSSSRYTLRSRTLMPRTFSV